MNNHSKPVRGWWMPVVLLAIGALLVLVGGCATSSVPMTSRPDTRRIIQLEIDRAVLDKAIEFFRLSAPNEAAICWQGEVLPLTVNGQAWQRILVHSFFIAVSDSVTEFNVFFPRGIPSGCVGKDYIGISHSHTQPSPMCSHSHDDVAVLFYVRRALFSIVFCANGDSELLYQDGRRVPHRFLP